MSARRLERVTRVAAFPAAFQHSSRGALNLPVEELGKPGPHTRDMETWHLVNPLMTSKQTLTDLWATPTDLCQPPTDLPATPVAPPQALEAIKALTGVGAPSSGRMLVLDALGSRPFMSVQTRPRDSDCPACGRDRRAAFALEACARKPLALAPRAASPDALPLHFASQAPLRPCKGEGAKGEEAHSLSLCLSLALSRALSRRCMRCSKSARACVKNLAAFTPPGRRFGPTVGYAVGTRLSPCCAALRTGPGAAWIAAVKPAH